MGNCFSGEDDTNYSNNNNNNNTGTSPAKSNRPVAGDDSAGSILLAPKNIKDLRENVGYSNVDVFTHDEMRLATKNFRPDLILGEGGFGVVYKGVIDEHVREGYKSTQVAIKVLNPEGFQGDREWLTEVNYLAQLSHPNLVKLIGYCCEEEHRLLVYEYMACGSLEKHLFRRVSLTMPWSTRMKVALDAARGLAFLHKAERPIIYRDFKTANILLDEAFNAKLSDFGLAKDGPMGDQTHVSTRIMGTYGYAAPEYVMTGHLTARSDVYGFGVVLLEMLIGRQALDKSRPSREHNLVEWARPLLNHRKTLKILDPRMEGQYSSKVAQKVALLAYQCLSQNPRGRPTMSQVVEILEPIQTPPSLEGVDAPLTLYQGPPKSLPEHATHVKRSPISRDGEEKPMSLPDHVTEEKRSPRRPKRSPRRHHQHGGERRTPAEDEVGKPAKARSKSEPSTDTDLYAVF